MPPRDYKDRRVEVYFGPSRKVSLSKEELADFIIETMGLIRSDGGPKWTEGVVELTQLGMEAYEKKYENNPEYAEEVARLNQKLDEYQREVRELASTQQKPVDTRIQAAKLTYRTQARILKVLSDAGRPDDDILPFMDISKVAKEVDLHYSVVSYNARLLEKSEIGGFVRRDKLGEKVKATSKHSFTQFCKSRGVDPESV